MTKLDDLSENGNESGENKSWDSSKLTHQDRKKLCGKYSPDSEAEIACSAPLCPLFDWEGIFYSDEGICSRQKYCKELIVRNQRKIARQSRDTGTYFTSKMLNRNIIIKSGIRGLDPDHALDDMDREEKEWLRAHPAKRILSDEARNELRERFSRVRGKNTEKKVACDREN